MATETTSKRLTSADYRNADPGPPAYRLGSRVWYGRLEFGSGWCFVTGLRLTPTIAEDSTDEGDVFETFTSAEWHYFLTRESSGREWGWCRGDEVSGRHPDQVESIHDEPPISSDPAEGIETAELVIPPPMIDPTDALMIGHDGQPVYESEMPF